MSDLPSAAIRQMSALGGEQVSLIGANIRLIEDLSNEPRIAFRHGSPFDRASRSVLFFGTDVLKCPLGQLGKSKDLIGRDDILSGTDAAGFEQKPGVAPVVERGEQDAFNTLEPVTADRAGLNCGGSNCIRDADCVQSGHTHQSASAINRQSDDHVSLVGVDGHILSLNDPQVISPKRFEGETLEQAEEVATLPAEGRSDG